MSSTRSLATGVAVSAILLLSSLGAAGPVAAAESPEGAVNELFDIVASGEFSRLDEIVCEAERDAVRELFDLGEQLGVDSQAAFLDGLSYQIDNRSVQLLSEDGDIATLQISGDISMVIAEDQIEGLVRAILEADRGPDDPPIDDAEVEMMVGFMGSAFNQGQPIDEEVTVVREDGQWLVCGGLIGESQEPQPGFEPSVSTEGLCGLVSPAELSAAGALEIDSSSGFESFCNYSSSGFDTFSNVQVNLSLDEDAASIAAFFEADRALEIAGATAYATQAEGSTQQLFTQAGEDLLQVTVTLDEDTFGRVDWLTEATLVTELFLPRLADFRIELIGPTPAPTPEPTPEISLCEALSLDDINAITGLGFDDASGAADFCSYSSTDGDPGYHAIAASLAPLSLDEYRAFMNDVEDITVAGLPAITGLSQLIIELPDGTRTLSVFAILDPSDDAVTFNSDELAIMVAELLLPNVPAQVAAPPEVRPEDPVSINDGQQALARPLCEYIDLDTVNAIGVVEYDTVLDIGPDFCSISHSQSDLEAGMSQLMVYLETSTMDELRTFYPGGTDLDIAGRVGYERDGAVWLQTDAALISVQVFLPDAAVSEGREPGEITIPVAEMLATSIEADTDD